MRSNDLSATLTTFLAQDIDRATAATISAKLAAGGHGETALELLTELRNQSRKVVAAAVGALPGVLDLLPRDEVVMWIDLAVSLNAQSGAAAVKYCQESSGCLGLLASSARGPVLRMVLELAEQEANVALEGLRHAPGVVAAAGVGVTPVWAEIGADLAKLDYVLGIEYLRRGPEILKVLAVDDLKAWAAVGLKLVVPNSLGKPDYLASLAFYRTSPMLLGDLATPAVRRRVLALGSLLADHSPEQAIGFFGEAPGWLRRIQDHGRQERVLRYGMLVAEQDAAAALAYLRRAAEVIELIGPDTPNWDERFEEWYRGGMEVLAYNHEAARAYFAVETRKALAAIEQSMSGVALRGVTRYLKLFAEGLSGHAVTIRAVDDDGVGSGASPSRAQSKKGTIYLPARIGLYPTREENLRLYKVLTAHEAGHLEYGTYDVAIGRLQDLATQACLRYGHQPVPALGSLDDLFQLYPHPMLVRDLWMLAEDARIEACLQAEYPGLRRDMEAMAREQASGRSLTHGLTAREMVVELLLQLSAGDPDRVRVPDALEEVVGRAWALLQSVAHPHATAEAVVRAVHRAYVLIEELTASEAAATPDGAPSEPERGSEPRAGEEQGGTYRPVTNFAHRGAMDAERIRGAGEQAVQDRSEWADRNMETRREPTPAAGLGSAQGLRSLQETLPGGTLLPRERAPASLAADVLMVPSEGEEGGLPDLPGQRVFLYDEWDGTIQDYRTRWCRVLEQAGPEGSEAFLAQTRSTYGGVVTLIRRYFEGIRPPAFRRVRRQADGEEVDIEAAVERLVERRAQASPSEFVYIRRDRRDRDVAAVFLVDLSGSTGKQIGPGGARIIDVEKEGLVLLCEALEAIGDQYAVYGYSGRSRSEVQILVLKDFDERYGPQVWRRIDAVRPMTQNRDGAAIRHALYRLSARAARVKLLILLSDGRPLDDAYQEDYALEDTKAALQEVKARGVHPFCITVDTEAHGYLARMYGEVCYLIIDRVHSLPERLPRIYRTLTS